MSMPAGFKPDLSNIEVGARRRFACRIQLAAFGLLLLGFLAIGLAGARPAIGADPTIAPPVAGQSVYDKGGVLSTHSKATAQALAAHIEAAGGGRVIVYTGADSDNLPDATTLAKSWHVDGLLMVVRGSSGEAAFGATLKGKLTSGQFKTLSGNDSPGMETTESWLTSMLARADGFLSGTHVFDGAGVLDQTAKQHAETAAKNLGDAIGGTVYVDIAIGGDDPFNTAFFNGAGSTSDLGKSMMIALAVSDDGRIGGYIYSDSGLWDSFKADGPWSSQEISNVAAANHDVQAAVLAAIDAVQKPPLIPMDAIPWIIFVVVVVLFSVTAPFLWGPLLIRRLAGVPAPIQGGLPGSAVIESIADTGVTVSMPGVGAKAPDYMLGLLVTPAGGGTPYQVEVKTLVPRIFIPMIVPGATIAVTIDPNDPRKIVPNWQNLNSPSVDTAHPGGGRAGGLGLDLDASGNPNMNQVAALAGAVNSGSMPTQMGSAARLLATGTHGTATITSAMPLGRTVGQVNPSADPATLNDPIWMFTVEVQLAGQAPFPAVFGHRVPIDKLALVAPGVRLSVAVDEADKNNEVAIDWTKSPLA